MISKDEFDSWKAHPVTRLVLQEALRLWIENLKSQWEKGQFSSPNRDEHHVMNLQALGQVRLLNELIELDYDKLLQVLHDE